MGLYLEESLDQLRAATDLVDVISSHIQLKRSGATYKALCPFHEEKTPSFQVQAGSSHYHCFGCGAHGDAIAFLMSHLNLTFVEAVESLADRCGVHLEKGRGEKKGPDKGKLKACLELACSFFHTLLLHTEEGRDALRYLSARGIDRDFIHQFRIGYALKERNAFFRLAKGEGMEEKHLIQAGLVTEKGGDFFSERIIFPISDSLGSVIGFSGRKIREEVFGGKYINTPETPLFKKSQTLFALNHCRRRIAREKRAIVVEGQMDALRLIHGNLDLAVAAQGTAFGEGHVKLLKDLGVTLVYLAMDGDEAGREAAEKVGNLFLRKSIDAKLVELPDGSDPDTFVRGRGIAAFEALLNDAKDYLTCAVERARTMGDFNNPAEKNALIGKLAGQIRSWEEPVLIHESLRKLARLTSVPESVVGASAPPAHHFIQRVGRVGKETVDFDLILETDLLRWLLLSADEQLLPIAKLNLTPDLLRNPLCRRLFKQLLVGPTDLMALGATLESEEEQKLLTEIVQKKVNPAKAREGLIEVIRRLLIRNWMEEREAIRTKLQNGNHTDEEALELAKTFDELKRRQPVVALPD